MSLLCIKPDEVETILLMRKGLYKNQNSLDLLKQSADWVETRIFNAISRAGFDPDEQRNLVSFKPPQPLVDIEIPSTAVNGLFEKE